MVTSPRAKTYHGNFLAKAVYLSIHCVYGVVTMSIIAVSAMIQFYWLLLLLPSLDAFVIVSEWSV